MQAWGQGYPNRETACRCRCKNDGIGFPQDIV